MSIAKRGIGGSIRAATGRVVERIRNWGARSYAKRFPGETDPEVDAFDRKSLREAFPRELA